MKKVRLLYRFLIFINIMAIILIGVQTIFLVIPDLYQSKVYEDHILACLIISC
jgi:hypothetical protein